MLYRKKKIKKFTEDKRRLYFYCIFWDFVKLHLPLYLLLEFRAQADLLCTLDKSKQIYL